LFLLIDSEELGERRFPKLGLRREDVVVGLKTLFFSFLLRWPTREPPSHSKKEGSGGVELAEMKFWVLA